MRLRVEVLIAVFMVVSTVIYSQSPYHFDWKKETIIVGVGSGTVGLGMYLRQSVPLYTEGQISALKSPSFNSLDRSTIYNYSVSADAASDVFYYGSLGLPLAFLSAKLTRKDVGIISALWAETLLLNTGVTVLTKHSFRRTRPFVYNPNVPIDDKLSLTAKSSFISGHTSTTAANTFFVAKVFSDYYPDSKWKPIVWGAAITAPAITGYLRVKAGKHFPTDVILGYAVGATIGYFVPQMHKRLKKGGLSVYGGMSGVLLNYQF